MGWKSENEISIALKLKQVKSSIFKNSSNLICGFPRRPRKFLHLFRFLRLLFLVSWTTHKSTAERAWKVPQFYPLLLLHTPIPEETDCFRKLLLIDLKKTHPPQGICHTLVKQAEFKVDVWSTTVKRLPWWKRESRILATVTHIKVPFIDNCDDKLLVRKLFCRKKDKELDFEKVQNTNLWVFFRNKGALSRFPHELFFSKKSWKQFFVENQKCNFYASRKWKLTKLH